VESTQLLVGKFVAFYVVELNSGIVIIESSPSSQYVPEKERYTSLLHTGMHSIAVDAYLTVFIVAKFDAF
jgi:hypothetical protein